MAGRKFRYLASQAAYFEHIDPTHHSHIQIDEPQVHLLVIK